MKLKKLLFLGRKVMTTVDSILKSRDITLPTKVCLVKAVVFPVVVYGCESWTMKKAEHRRIDTFELWYWRRQWHPTPVLLSGKSDGRRSLVGCSPWGWEESDTTERLHFHFSLRRIGEGNGNHSSILAWRIPGMEEPGGLPSMGSHRVGHD